MQLLEELGSRSNNKCELCASSGPLEIYEVPPVTTGGVDGSILVCATCKNQIENQELMESNHWRCLNDSMWSEHDVVKVISWRMLSRLKLEGWPKDLLEMMDLDDTTLAWAKATGEGLSESERIIHRDTNGVILENGDNVVLIKDLKVKGSSMVAKQGTAVRRISLDRENAAYVEGKVDGQQIVLITKYIKKI
ncbi:PhnA domain-containing protein [Maribacter aestuarii]|uniref:PhnA domain-containing protein n=1 Tax=Maribacter aestuarii TaxID=1130723 RepID=UPI00248C5956|nr:alkylphosphonate utilization protein [Maribacter aestuarii]